jgi:molybdopterin-dependent oxidoreductase alpha subunit
MSEQTRESASAANHRAIKDRSPEKLGDLRATKPLKIAAGIKAIWATVTDVYGKMGVGRGTRTLLKLNQKGGIDCQSCAWADPDDHRTVAEFCESGAKALADEGMTARITGEFFRKHSVAELSEKTDYWLNSQGRLTHPMVLRKGATHYEEISWDDAIALIAKELKALDSPDEAIFYTSGRTSNEAAFLYQLFVRQFGTNNMPDCSNMCHESTSVGLAESTGLGKANVRIEDFAKTDLVIIIGQNPGTNAPRMMSSLEEAKKAGAKMIAINPLPEAGLLNFVNPNPQHGNPLVFPFKILANASTKFADLYLHLRIGGDMAVLKGMMKTVLERERQEPGSVFDHDFIDEHTNGYEKLLKTLDATAWEDILSESGLERSAIEEAAEMFMQADRVITCWAMGVTQHKHAVATIQDIANMHFLRGQIGKPGAGLCPVRGHSNVQGDRTMGIWEKMDPKFREALEKEFDFKTPKKDGHSTVDAIRAMHEGSAKVFFAMGGNFVTATPDTDFTAEALQKCNLTAQVITKLNRTALVTGEQALILPCLGRTEIDTQSGGEQFVSTESTMMNVQMSRGILPPASKCLRSEPWIVAQLARATLGENTTVDWEKMAANYDNIRDAISRVVAGCENYNDNIRLEGGFYLPNKPMQRQFPTKSERAEFISAPLQKIVIGEGRLLMTTIRAHNQFNTTVYDLSDRYRGIHGERRVILLNPDDMRARDLKPGQVVDLTSHFDDGERHAYRFIAVPYQIPKGCAATYFPEANPLIPVDSYADKSKCPTSKCTVISIEATGEIAGTFAYDYMKESSALEVTNGR